MQDFLVLQAITISCRSELIHLAFQGPNVQFARYIELKALIGLCRFENADNPGSDVIVYNKDHTAKALGHFQRASVRHNVFSCQVGKRFCSSFITITTTWSRSLSTPTYNLYGNPDTSFRFEPAELVLILILPLSAENRSVTYTVPVTTDCTPRRPVTVKVQFGICACMLE